MQVKIYEELPKCALDIRTEVFIHEQGFEYELDERDKLATHFVVFDMQTPIATCRVFFDLELNAYRVGGICVLKAHRGQKIGSLLMQTAEDFVREKGGERLCLRAQCTAIPFYEKCGYLAHGEIFYEEWCPHRLMEKKIL